MYNMSHDHGSGMRTGVNIKDHMGEAHGRVYTPLMLACAINNDCGLSAVKVFLDTYDNWERENINLDKDKDENEDRDGDEIANKNNKTRQQVMSLFDVQRCTTGGIFNVFHAALNKYKIIKYLLQYCKKHMRDRNINITRMITDYSMFVESPYELARIRKLYTIVHLFDQYL